MDGPLWTERHAPEIADLPQPEARERFEGAKTEPMNLLVHGPIGVGKTAAVRALAKETHANPDADLIEINVADVFDMTKKEISEDPRFASFIDAKRRRNSSKADLLNHVLKESAANAPVSGAYKTVLLDNAEGMREDFQQALRRVMEQYHESTQFVIATRQPSALIPPIRSRCFPIVMRAPTHDETVAVLESIVDAEGGRRSDDAAGDDAGADAEDAAGEDADDATTDGADDDGDAAGEADAAFTYDADGLEYVAGYADGDLRSAILSAQTTVEREGELTMQAAYEALDAVEGKGQVEAMIDAAVAGEFTDARSTLDDLLVDEGHAGTDVLEDVLAVVRSRWSGDRVAEVHRLAGEIDADLHEGSNDRLHVSHLLAELGELDASS